MARDHVELATALNAFGGQDAGDLRALDAVILEAVSLPATFALDQALFGIFERFPEEDGYGVYWNIVHGLERRGGYEHSLLASVRRCPSPFSLLMLNRLCNGGATHCAGADIVSVLREVAHTAALPMLVRKEAEDFLNHQQDRRKV